MTTPVSTMPPTKTLLITGATGKQGGAVINALLSRLPAPSPSTPPPFHILALTRDPTSPSALRLRTKSPPSHLTLLKGDLNSTPSIFASLPSSHPHIHGVFSVQLPKFGFGPADVAAEEQQGNDLVDAAIAHGHVERFVYSSVDRGGPERSERDATYVPHFASKFRVEGHLRERCGAAAAAAAAGVRGDGGTGEGKRSGMSWTILRTVAFYENLTDDFPGRVFASIWKGLGRQKMQLIGTKDVGWFAAEALVGNPEVYRDRAVSIAGDELDFEEASRVYKEVLGREMPTAFGLLVKPLRWAMSDLDLMFKWLQDNRAGADVHECRRMNAGMLDFGAWLRETKVRN